MVRVFNYSSLRDYFEDHADVKAPLLAWYDEATKGDWQSPSDIKSKFRSADFVEGDRVIFNIKGNKYRLVVAIRYEFHAVYIRFIGTHAEYSKVNAATV
jgi:mRNA interferase HigB